MSLRSPPGTPDLANLARGVRAGVRGVLARAITLIESRRADHQAAARSPSAGSAARDRQRLYASASPAFPGRQVDHHRCARHLPHRQWPQGRGARGRSVLGAQRRLDPGGQDAHGPPRRRSQCLRAPLAIVRTLGGVAAKTRESMLICEGRGLRRRAGRDRRHRAVRDHGRGHDRFLSGPDACPARATSCRASRRASSRSPT